MVGEMESSVRKEKKKCENRERGREREKEGVVRGGD